jgi:gliding motility-associated lipoprotein GldD
MIIHFFHLSVRGRHQMGPSNCCWLLLSLLLFLTSCGGDDTALTPKPRGYPRVFYPEKAYRQFDTSFCRFTFEYPRYVEVQQDTAFLEERPLHPCWFDLYFPSFDSRIHFSYYDVGAYKSLEQLREDAFEMADWHNKRANYIEEIRIAKPEENVYGFAFEIEGPAASSYQFYLTDSTRHFLRGALYFNTQAQPDSLAPITEFVREDIERLIETFRWVER